MIIVNCQFEMTKLLFKIHPKSINSKNNYIMSNSSLYNKFYWCLTASRHVLRNKFWTESFFFFLQASGRKCSTSGDQEHRPCLHL